MRLVGRDRIDGFVREHPDSSASLRAWKQNIEANAIENFIALKRIFGSADYVRPYVIFNIAGNKYRLIAMVDYALGAVSVEYLLTHANYDKGKWRRG